MGQIYVIVVAKDTASCKQTVNNLVSLAYHPRKLRIHMAILAEKEEELVNIAAPASSKVEYFKEEHLDKVLRKLYKEYKKEKYALQVIGNMDFEIGWDKHLREVVDFPKEKKAVFSFMPMNGEAYNIGIENVKEEKIEFCNRIKTSSYFEPIESLFVTPRLIFGRGEWMKIAAIQRWKSEDILSLSVSALIAGYQIYTSQHCFAFFNLKEEEKKVELSFPLDEKEEGFFLSLEINVEEGKNSLNGYMGLKNNYHPYFTQISLSQAYRQYKGRKQQSESDVKPMFFTAWEERESPLQQEILLKNFSYLSHLYYFPLTVYGPKKCIKALTSIFPNTFPLEEIGINYQKKDVLERGLSLFLKKGIEQFSQYSHYGWVKMDYLTYSLYDKQAFIWESLKDDHIHLGVKNGKIDEGLLILPKEKLLWFSEEMLQYQKEGKSLNQGLETMVEKTPYFFTLYDFDQYHQLLEAFLYE